MNLKFKWLGYTVHYIQEPLPWWRSLFGQVYGPGWKIAIWDGEWHVGEKVQRMPNPALVMEQLLLVKQERESR